MGLNWALKGLKYPFSLYVHKNFTCFLSDFEDGTQFSFVFL
jgi:hypothetical protein